MHFMKRLLLGGALLMLTLVFVTGCQRDKGKKPQATTTGETQAKDEVDYMLFHTKDETHHVRLKIDQGDKKATATIYDSENKEIKPIEAESLTLNLTDPKAQIMLKAQRAKGDPEGKSSVFVAEHERLAKDVSPEKIEIAGKIAGKNYVFELDKEHGKEPGK